MRRRHEQDRRDVGLEGARERREVSRARRAPSRRPSSPGLRGRFITDIGNPIWLFWLPGVFSTAKRRARIAAAKSLVVVLPAEPVIAARRKPVLPLRSQTAKRSSASVVSRHEHGPESVRAGRAGRRSARSARAPRATASRGEVVPVDPGARDRDEEIAGAHLRASRRRRPRATPRRRRGRPRAAATSSEGEVHARSRELGRDRAVVERDLRGRRSPASSRGPCRRSRRPCRGSASSIAARIASRRSAIARYFVAPEAASPASTSRRIASGILGARIVGRRDRDVGEPARDLAHRRALAAVAIAAAAEDEHDLPVRQLAHRLEQPLERVGRVRVVDEDRIGLPGLDALEPARHVAHARRRAAATSSGGIAEAEAGRGRGESGCRR